MWPQLLSCLLDRPPWQGTGRLTLCQYQTKPLVKGHPFPETLPAPVTLGATHQTEVWSLSWSSSALEDVHKEEKTRYKKFVQMLRLGEEQQDSLPAAS